MCGTWINSYIHVVGIYEVEDGQTDRQTVLCWRMANDCERNNAQGSTRGDSEAASAAQ